MAKNELQINKGEFAIIGAPAAELDAFRDNLGGQQLKATDLDRVKFPSGGGTYFQVPSLDGTTPANEIEGIVVGFRDGRIYWAGEFSGAGTPPDCVSENGHTGIGSPGGSCISCPLNEWGSDPKGGKGKACAEVRLLFVITKERRLPLVVTLPPTSLGNCRKFFMRLSSFGKAYWQVVSKITLIGVKNAAGIPYAQADFKVARNLEDGEIGFIRRYKDELGLILGRVEVQAAAAETMRPEE